MKTRWKFLIIAGFVLDLVTGFTVWYLWEENGTQWETMTTFAHNLVDGRKFHAENSHGEIIELETPE